MAGLLHVMLTGLKLFWSSRKEKKRWRIKVGIFAINLYPFYKIEGI